MRVLHLVKTSEGAHWAVLQARELVQQGIEVHVALPHKHGRAIEAWKSTGATIHFTQTDLALSRPFLQFRRVKDLQRLIDTVKPELVHSHFFQSTVTARMALKHQTLPVIFQVPGPLHMENRFFRNWDLKSARDHDYWIASSKYIEALYLAAGVACEKLSVSYYGTDIRNWPSERENILRAPLGIGPDEKVVGSICWMYPPKWYLGHRRGIKNHELIIEASKHLLSARKDVHIVLAGGPWGSSDWYFDRLKRLARAVSPSRIHLPGPIPAADSRKAWADFDCVVHVPTSENCGGVIEPLLARRPVVASATGGIPEVIEHRKTGTLLSEPSAIALADSIQRCLSDADAHARTERGRERVEHLFDVEKSAQVVSQRYAEIIAANPPSNPIPLSDIAK